MKPTKKSRLAQGAATSLAAAICFSCAVPAVAQEARYSFDIPAQNLDSALKTFGRTTKRQLVYDGRKVRNLRSKALKGEFTAREGLAILVDGSGLSARTGETGVLIVASATADVPAKSGNVVADSEAADPDFKGIADILVIGRLSQNSGIRRTENDALPYRVFDQKDIQASQATTLEDFFRTRVTTNSAKGSEAQRTSGFTSNGPGSTRSSINLRGLGTNQTLILVDGRRLGDLSIQNLGSSIGGGQPDINGIPLASIERIEILSSAAAAIYGGGAVGGAINIILRHDYRGLELTANYQDTGDFKYPSGRLDIVGGLALEGGKTNITFSGSFSRTGVMKVGDRPFSQRGFALGLANSPDTFIPPDDGSPIFAVPVGRGVNIFNGTGAALTLKPAYGGGSIDSAFTNLPLGFSGSPLALGAALTANAGELNLEQPTGNNGRMRSLMSAPEMRSFNINIRRKFADWLDIYADYSKFQNRGSALASIAAPEGLFLPATAPTNPFNEGVFAVFDNQNLAKPYISNTDTNRATLGFNIRLPHHWGISFDYTWNWSRQSAVFTQVPIDNVGFFCARLGIAPSNVGTGLNQCPATTGGTTTDTRAPINIITNPDFSAYLNPAPNTFGNYATSLWTPALRISGPLFALPAGPVNFSGYVDRSLARTKRGYQRGLTYANGQTSTVLSQSFRIFAPAEQDATSFYGELSIPLFSQRNATTLMRNLSFQLSLRHDKYKTTASAVQSGSAFSRVSFSDAIAILGGLTQSASNDTTNYTIAGEYSPVDGITFRGSYGTGYLQPSVNEVAASVALGNFRVRDPSRGNLIQPGVYTTLNGGLGLDFKPETSTSYTFGVILQPHFVPGDLRISADYSKIKRLNEITNISLRDLIVNPDRYPGRLIRDPLTPADIALGYTAGAINTINLTKINLYKSSVTAIDFQVDYAFGIGKLGQLRAYGSASWQPDFFRQTFADTPSLNYSGFIDGPLEWRGNGGLEWTYGNLGVQYNAQYYGPYAVYSPLNSAIDAADAIKLQGSSRIPRQIYHDLYISYAIPASSGVLHGVKLSVGVQNLLNTSPPTVATLSYADGGYSGYGDPRLRRFTLTLKKAFGN